MGADKKRIEAAVLCGAAVLLAFMAGYAIAARPRPGSYTISARATAEQTFAGHADQGGETSLTGPVAVNVADAETLSTLPGITPALAARIVSYRDTHGAFGSIDALTGVPGVGYGTLEAIRDFITLY